MTGDQYSIELSVGDAWLSVSGPEDFVEEKFYELYEEHDFSEMEVSSSQNPSVKEEGAEESNPQEENTENLSELISESEINSKKDKALAVGWSLQNFEGQSNFTKPEIESKALEEQVEIGQNLTRDVNNLVDDDYLYPATERDDEQAYWVKDEGEEYLNEMGLRE